MEHPSGMNVLLQEDIRMCGLQLCTNMQFFTCSVQNPYISIKHETISPKCQHFLRLGPKAALGIHIGPDMSSFLF